MAISRTGMDVEWRRLEIIAENLANISTTRVPGGGTYQPRELISGPANGSAAKAGGVAIYSIEAQNVAPRLVHEPGHPDADARGFVTRPRIDHAAEMTLMIKTSRAYESNVVAMNLARQMYSKALELGRRG